MSNSMLTHMQSLCILFVCFATNAACSLLQYKALCLLLSMQQTLPDSADFACRFKIFSLCACRAQIELCYVNVRIGHDSLVWNASIWGKKLHSGSRRRVHCRLETCEELKACSMWPA